MTPNDDILGLAAQRAAGMKLKPDDQDRLDAALLADPDLALLILDAQDTAAALSAAASPTRQASTSRATLAALVMGLLACFGVGATAGAQLAGGLVSANKAPSAHQIDVRAIGDGLSLSFDAARKKK
jgi:hypothetical protein